MHLPQLNTARPELDDPTDAPNGHDAPRWVYHWPSTLTDSSPDLRLQHSENPALRKRKLWRDQTHPVKAPPQGRTPASRTPVAQCCRLFVARRCWRRATNGNSRFGPRLAAVQIPFRKVAGFLVKHRRTKDSRCSTHGRHPHDGHARISRVDVSPHPGIP